MTMLREYAVEPEALARHPLPLMITTAFGPHSGRYLATVQSHQKWRREVARAVHRLREEGHGHSTATERLLAWIEQQKNTDLQTLYVERPEAQYDGNRNWLENILAAHAVSPYDAVLTHEGNNGTRRLEDAHEGQEWWLARQSERIQKTPAEYARVLGSTLRRSRDVLLLDPFFKPEGRPLAVLRALLVRLDPALRPRVEVVCLKGDESRNTVLRDPEFVHQCRRNLGNLIPEGTALTVRRVDAMPEEKYHDRFLLTDRLSLMVGYGFDGTDDDTRTTTVSTIGPGTATELRTWINDASRFSTGALWSSDDTCP